MLDGNETRMVHKMISTKLSRPSNINMLTNIYNWGGSTQVKTRMVSGEESYSISSYYAQGHNMIVLIISVSFVLSSIPPPTFATM